jgi:4-hydroxy-3-polyprenylbenzoate decarboxylase
MLLRMPAAPSTFRAFLDLLDRAGELLRVPGPVSPILDVAALADQHARLPAAAASEWARAFDPGHAGRGGSALLVENVEGCDFPLAINVFGSYRRAEMALGCADGGFGQIADRIGMLAQPKPPTSLREGIAMARDVLPLLRTPPKRKKSGRCQEVVKLASDGTVDLTRLPLIKCWPLDGDPAAVGYDITAEAAGTARGEGRYITFAGMHTIHADDRNAAKPSSHNIGMYRAQLIDETHLAMHWHMHHDGAAHWRSWKKIGERMPIAICLGGEPVMPYAATSPLPPGLSELLLAGFLNGGGIPLVRARTVPLWVPANSEIVIEGWVSTECGPIGWEPGCGEPLGPGAVFEGPFGDHTGYYSLPDRYPIVEVTAITHARDAVFPATVVGLPPQEDYYLGKATERLFMPLLQTLIPDLADYHLPMFGCFHNCAFIRIDKAYPLQARRIMHAVWGAGQMAWTKLIVVVDDDVDVHTERAVLEAICRNTRFDRDLELVNGPLDILDHASPRLGAGHKLGIDATSAWAGEEVGGIDPADGPVFGGADGFAAVGRILEAAGIAAHVPDWGGGRCVVAPVEKSGGGEGPAAAERIWDAIEAGAHEGVDARWFGDLLILVDVDAALEDDEDVWFRLCSNSDPGRDLVRRGHRIAFDATAKLPADARNGQPVRRFPPRL